MYHPRLISDISAHTMKSENGGYGQSYGNGGGGYGGAVQNQVTAVCLRSLVHLYLVSILRKLDKTS